MKFQDAIEEFLITKAPELTHKTKQWYTHKLGIFCEWCEGQNPPITQIEEVTNVLISRFIGTLKDHSSYTRRGYVQVIKCLLNWCVEYEEGEVSEKVVKHIRLPRIEQSQITILTPEEIQRLRLAVLNTPYPERNLALIDLLLDTGVRASEIAYDSSRPEERTGLLMKDIHITGEDTENPYMRVMGKGRKTREVPLGETSRASLQRYIQGYRGKSKEPYVFLNRRGKPITVRGLESIIEDLGEEAKVEKIHPHKFRHTYACLFLMHGGAINDLRILMGHTKIETSMLYLRAVEHISVRDRAHSVLDRMGRR